MSLEDRLMSRLRKREAEHRLRRRVVMSSAQSVTPIVNGKRILNFSANDYLGLANHPDLIRAFQTASKQYGVGSGASHLVCGHSEEHHALEEALAEFTGRSRAVLFSTGYMANLGVISAVLERKDILFEDKLNHASLLDAAQLSGAKWKRYPHSDLTRLAALLAAHSDTQTMIAVDAVFSMDGDIADLPALSALAKKRKAWLMVDDAHGFGVLGDTGAGTPQHYHLGQDEVPIYMGTLGKALGSFGAFVAGSETLIESLIQFARPYIYTTAMPPAVAAATRASLAVIQREPERRQRLKDCIAYFKQAMQNTTFTLMPSDTAIQPVLLGDESTVMSVAEQLKSKGILVGAIRPPTVPVGQGRLRITLSSEHSEQEIDRLVTTLSTISVPTTHAPSISE